MIYVLSEFITLNAGIKNLLIYIASLRLWRTELCKLMGEMLPNYVNIA